MKSSNLLAFFKFNLARAAASGFTPVPKPRADKYVATVPQIFDLWQDPQERYDIFMNNYTERTWTLVTINEEVRKLVKTYIEYPPRKLQSEVYTGPITLSQYERLQNVRKRLEQEGINIPLPTGN